MPNDHASRQAVEMSLDIRQSIIITCTGFQKTTLYNQSDGASVHEMVKQANYRA